MKMHRRFTGIFLTPNGLHVLFHLRCVWRHFDDEYDNTSFRNVRVSMT